MVYTDKPSGSGGAMEIRRYTTSDSVATVDNWYRTNAPYLQRTATGTSDIEFDNPASDGLFSNIIGFLNGAGWGFGPSGSLIIQPDPDKPNVTDIYLSIGWPIP